MKEEHIYTEGYIPPTREHGPSIVAIGGGTGLSTMLRGLKLYTKNITAIVTVTDDGGGSGILRRDLGMLPPGDIRGCIQALANVEPVMEQLMGYRFSRGRLKGQSFGNLFLAALNGISHSFDQAVSRMSEVLAITGQVLPVSNENVTLEAQFENGTTVAGESKIAHFQKKQNCRIVSIRLRPHRPHALPEAIKAIANADIILLGPGSLYTSIIPNLLVDGIADAIFQSNALKIYVCNIMTQSGETDGYTTADHVEALLAHTRRGLIDICLANSAPIPFAVKERYWAEGAQPIEIDEERLGEMQIELVTGSLAASAVHCARHDPDRLALALLTLHGRRNVRLAAHQDEPVSTRYRLDR